MSIPVFPPTVLRDLGISPYSGDSEPFGEVFGDSDLAGIDLGKSEIIGDKHDGFFSKTPCYFFSQCI